MGSTVALPIALKKPQEPSPQHACMYDSLPTLTRTVPSRVATVMENGILIWDVNTVVIHALIYYV